MNGASVKVLTTNDYKTSKWSGGETTEIAIFPDGSSYKKRDFLWRLSSAAVTCEKSTFTNLPGIHRHLMLLQGSVTLGHEGSAPVKLIPFECDSFDGGIKTESVGIASDFNLMTAAGCDGRLSHFICGMKPALFNPEVSDSDRTEAFYASGSPFTAHVNGEQYQVLCGGTILISIKKGCRLPPVIVSSKKFVNLVHATMYVK